MSTFSKIKGFFSRHRNKFIVGGIIISGSILLTRYAQQRIKEWQERETLEFLEKNRKQHHFESIGRTCNQTILNLSNALSEAIFKAVNTEEFIEELKTNPKNKIEIWNKLKTLILVRAGCTIYSIVLLVVTLRIQMNIIGGYLYKDPTSISIELQEKYLSLCQKFLNVGVEKLAKLLETEVDKIVENIELKKQLKLSDIESIFWALQTAIATNNDNPIDKLRQYMVLEEESNTDGIYSNMLRDTADLLDSDEVKSIATHCVSRGFILLTDKISEFYTQNGITELPSSSETKPFQNPFDSSKPFVKILPILNGLLPKQSFPNSFVQQLIANDKVQILGANVYESLL